MKWLAASVLLWAAMIASIPVHAQAIAEGEASPESAAPTSVATEGTAVGASEIPPLIPTEHLAARNPMREFEISPDGSMLAIRTVAGQKNSILILDAYTGALITKFEAGDFKKYDWIAWASETKLIFSTGSMFYRQGRKVYLSQISMHSFDTGLTFQWPLGDQIFDNRRLIYAATGGNFALISAQEEMGEPPSVFRYELQPEGGVKKLVQSREGVWSWFADNAGVVRMGIGWHKRRLHIHYRPDARSRFELIDKLDPGEDDARFWRVAKIISGSDQGYVLAEGDDGKMGIRLFDYASGSAIETFYEHPQWDIDSMWLDESGTPRAAFYTDDRRRAIWFDEDYERFFNSLTSSLPYEDISIVSSSRDRERVLVWAGNEADPGALFLSNGDGTSIQKLADYRPMLDSDHLSKPMPISYTARDGLLIHGYLTLPVAREPKDLPLIILPHGGPYDVRDSLEYNDEVQFLANRGYAVLQPNFRGSGGYGDAHYDAGYGEIGRKMQDDLDDAMDWAVLEGFVDPDRVCVVGSSYGGYAALWAVLRNPERYRCAASWAGVTDFEAILKYNSYFLSRQASREWRRQVRGTNDFDLASVSPNTHAGKLDRPVLIAHGTNDRVVPFDQYQSFEYFSNDAEYRPTKLTITGEGHSFSAASSEKQWYDALDRFLAKHNPADQVDSDGNLRKPELNDEDGQEAKAPLAGAES